MSTATLFGFGSVIFFVVMTGAFLYGLAAFRDLAERDK
jgi:hypothetical protein